MPDTDQQLDFLESTLPDLSGASFKTAQVQVLAAGHPVLVSGDDGVYQLAPDGTRTKVGAAPARLAVTPGTVVRLP